MIARLYCKTGALAGSEYQIGEEAVIGRQEENDITLSSEAVSGRHARIYYDDDEGCYVLEDLDSRTGTWLDATEVVEAVPLKDLHVVTFGESLDLVFQTVEGTLGMSSGMEGSQTQFGVAPEAPSDLSGDDEGSGERTRMGGVSGEMPEFPDEDADENVDRTRYEESPPDLPDLSEERDSEGDDASRTQYGQAPDTLPDLSDEDPASDDPESPSEGVDRTRFGESPPELPDLSSEDEPSGDHTRMGDAPGTLPDLSDEESSDTDEDPSGADEDSASGGTETPSDDIERTRFGESAPELPELSEEDEPDGDQTQMGGAPGTLPDPPPEDASDADEGEGDGRDEDDVEQTKMGAAAPGLPDLADDESSEDEDENVSEEGPPLSEAPTRAAPDQGGRSTASSPQYALHVTVEDESRDMYPLPEGEVTIGRSPDCDIQVEDPGVSREHARFVVDSGEVVVEDMGSKNFTFVDGNRLSGPTTLSQGSQIQFGLHVKAVLHRAPS